MSARCIFESRADFGGSLFTSVFMDYSFEWIGEPVCFRTGVIGIAWDNNDDFTLNDNYDNGLLLRYGNENGAVKNMKISDFSDFDKADSTEGTYLTFETSSGSAFANYGKGRLRIDSPKVISEGEAVQIVLAHGHQDPEGRIILETDEN